MRADGILSVSYVCRAVNLRHLYIRYPAAWNRGANDRTGKAVTVASEGG